LLTPVGYATLARSKGERVAKQQFQTLRGMYDILPEQAAVYDYLCEQYRRVVQDAGYGHIETPVLEDAALSRH
jgi:histidyl-tRNA synthetase